MKCFGVVPAASATQFSQASWITLSSGSVLLMQDTDYTMFSKAVAAVSGTMLPMFYDPTPLTTAQIAAVAPITVASGSAMLQLAQAAAALNPLMSL